MDKAQNKENSSSIRFCPREIIGTLTIMILEIPLKAYRPN
jgi:hypothetical protein